MALKLDLSTLTHQVIDNVEEVCCPLPLIWMSVGECRRRSFEWRRTGCVQGEPRGCPLTYYIPIDWKGREGVVAHMWKVLIKSEVGFRRGFSGWFYFERQGVENVWVYCFGNILQTVIDSIKGNGFILEEFFQTEEFHLKWKEILIFLLLKEWLKSSTRR